MKENYLYAQDLDFFNAATADIARLMAAFYNQTGRLPETDEIAWDINTFREQWEQSTQGDANASPCKKEQEQGQI